MNAQVPKATVCLWFDRNAEDAAKFYAVVSFAEMLSPKPAA
jgi:predicted 3-demethylubiquinone-9 3-methyltransferase (glyoxalase superfamily)